MYQILLVNNNKNNERKNLKHNSCIRIIAVLNLSVYIMNSTDVFSIA